MRRPSFLLAVACCLVLGLVLGLGGGARCAAAEEAATAADVTEPGRSLARAVRVALGSSETGKRTVVFLVDPTPSLEAAGFGDVFASEVASALGTAPKLHVGLVLATDTKGWSVAPTRDAGALASAVTEALAAAKANVRNVYASARRAGGLLAKRSGARELVLVSLENGAAEDDLAGTASALSRLKVPTSCVTTEAYLADSYYLSSKRTVPRGVSLGSGYMTRILTGGLMGTLMWANVWFVIWPAQKIVIAIAESVAGGGEANPAAAGAGAKAGMASRTNTLFSIPMLFFMAAASHLTGYADGSDPLYWVVVLGVVGLVEVNGLIGPGASTQKMLTTVSGTIHAGLGLTVVLYIWGQIVF